MRSHPEKALNLVCGWLKLDVAAPRLTRKQFRVNLLYPHLSILVDEARWHVARGHAGKGHIPNFLPRLDLDAGLAVHPQRIAVLDSRRTYS